MAWVSAVRFAVLCTVPCMAGNTSYAAEAQCSAWQQPPGSAVDLPIWRPDGNAPHGFQEFRRTTRIALPPGVGRLDVELWGGGGGGGGGSRESYTEGGAGGGGGASGAYTRLSVDVDPGSSYVVVIGHGGAGGGVGADGAWGDASVICRGPVALGAAAGGRGGLGAATNDHGGKGGLAAAEAETASAPAAAVLRRGGNGGGNGMRPLFHMRGAGGRGGSSVVAGATAPDSSFGGAGGLGEMRPVPAQPGAAGGDGLVIIRW